jgi:hypothetical protein
VMIVFMRRGLPHEAIPVSRLGCGAIVPVTI